MNYRMKPLSAALAAVLATPVMADTDLSEVKVSDTREAESYNPQVTTVGKGGATALRDVPQTVTVINREVMDAQGATTLTDVLRNVPGITLSAGEGGPIGDNVNLRGFSARTDVFMDGFRERGSYSRDTFFMETVEVLKGPSSMLFGQGSTGGVINYTSKVPTLRSHNDVSVGVGTEGFMRSKLDVNGRVAEHTAGRVSVMAQNNGSPRGADEVEAEKYGVALSMRWGIGTPTQLTVSEMSLRSREVPDYGVPVNAAMGNKPPKVDRENFYGMTDDRFDQDVDILTAKLEHEFNKNMSVRSQVMYAQADVYASPSALGLVNASSVTPQTPLEDIDVNRNRREREVEDASLFNQTDVTVKFNTGAIKHTLVTGLEVGTTGYERQAYDWANLDATSLTDPQPMTSGEDLDAVRTLGTAQESSGDLMAVFINDQIDLTDQWKLIAGLRHDKFDLDFEQTTNAGVVSKFDSSDSMTSVRAGVIFQPAATQSYYVSYGNSFNPSAEASTLNEKNENVDPEKNRSYEIGGKWEVLDEKLSLTAAAFQVEKTDARTRLARTDEYTLDGNQSVKGFELGAVGQINTAWQVIAGYSNLDGKYEKALEADVEGNELTNTPEHSVSLWTTHKVGSFWEVGGGAVYSSDRFLNNTNTIALDSYTRYDATVAYAPKGYSVRLNLLNVTDEEYYEVASAGRATPAEGRGAIVTGTYEF